MRPSRVLMALALVTLLAGVAYVGQRVEAPGVRMARAAEKFLNGLTAEQRARAVFAFDDKERKNFHFVPLQDREKRPTRKGVPLQDMTAEQKQAALDLLATGTSPSGRKKALTIMSLENILRELEKNGANVRNPEWYFFTVFGKPSDSGRWGWRVEGHHLSLNFTVEGGKVVSATPAFFGANPATVLSGPRKGLRTLPEAEDLAKELFRSLDDDQKKVALQKEEFPEIEQANVAPTVGAPRGLPAGRMTAAQREVLQRLLRSYADRLPAEVAEAQMAEVRGGGIDKVHFAYAGGLEQGQPHTYRVQGSTFVIEFLNVQPDSAGNEANHIHSAWRHLAGDFGETIK